MQWNVIGVVHRTLCWLGGLISIKFFCTKLLDALKPWEKYQECEQQQVYASVILVRRGCKRGGSRGNDP